MSTVRPARRRRGYALPLVMALVLLLSAGLTTALFGISGAVNIGESAVHRRQVYHEAEGVTLAAIELTSQHLRGQPLAPNVPPSDPGFPAAMAALMNSQRVSANAFLAAKASTYAVDGYDVQNASILELRPSSTQILQNGPFAGMLAQVQPFTIQVASVRVHDRSPATQLVRAEVERATISMFQFYVFSDVYLDLDPGGGVVTSGRIHTNDDFCIAGKPEVDRVTAAGRILISNAAHGLCRRKATESNNIRVYNDDTLTTSIEMTKDHTATDWVSYANNTMAKRLQDKAHKISPLKMPISGQPIVQAGVNVLAMERVAGPAGQDMHPIKEAREDNTPSMRFLVDPMLVNEPEDVRRQKFAFKADIRIIDGVWFIRDQTAPLSPGIPIWSDHPGAFSASDHPVDYVGSGPAAKEIIIAKLVGQEDVRSDETWSSSGPQLYSYYGFKDAGSGKLTSTRLPGSKRAVISYGVLARTGPGVFEPGFFASDLPSSHGVANTIPKILRGTRSGFKNGWMEARSESNDPDVGDGNSPVETSRSRLLPVNFDVAAFINALKNECSNNELGSYFPGSCSGGGRRFNGIVFITSTWPGSMDGLGSSAATSDFATLWPFQPNNDGLNNASLPMPLCGANGSIDKIDDGTGADVDVPSCRTLTRTGATAAYPNFVRVINAKHINPATSKTYASVTVPGDGMPGGLTIATNLPIALVGDANVDTTPKRRRFENPTNDRFVPFLIAGDRFHRHSNTWNDKNANWSQTMKQTAGDRQATDTTQYSEILAGWNPTPKNALGGHNHSSDGFEDFPRYNERWSCASSPAKVVYYGSIVVAFSSVFEHAGANNDAGHGTSSDFTTCFPRREEGFDFHLEEPTNQPPGTPQILAQSISSWSTR